MIPTRASLIQRLKDWSDQSSWQDFFDTYWRIIYNIARKRGLNDAESQDVVQETMFDVARHMPGFKYDPSLGSFKAWLFGLTKWRIADQYRRRLPVAPERPGAAHKAAMDGTLEPSRFDLEAYWDTEWENNLLQAAVGKVKRQMDPKRYQIFDFYVNKGWEAEKVAKTFGVTVNQVYLAKHRISESIREEAERLQKQFS
jgi:RNA polymerase sigma-70 factor (ECF subfamily)